MSELVDLPDGGQHYGGEEGGGHYHDRVLHRPTEYITNPIDVVAHPGEDLGEIQEILPVRAELMPTT